MLQHYYHAGPIDRDNESIKKSFNILSLLPPPINKDDEYERHINASRNTEADNILDQPSEKRSSIRKDIFIRGRQETLDDVISFIGNITVFARFWSKIPKDETSQPMLIQLILEIADFLSSSDFKNFYEHFKADKLYMPHTIISYLFNISSIFIKMAKNPNVIRRFKVEGIINHEEIKIAIIMQSALMDQLQLCSATSSPQNLFAQPPTSFKTFCPDLFKKQDAIKSNKRPNPFPDDKNGGKKVVTASKGSIVNETGKKIWFPSGLDKKYCTDFIDTSQSCRHGEKCHFVHAVFPTGFTKGDAKIIEEFVEKTDGLSFKSPAASGKPVS